MLFYRVKKEVYDYKTGYTSIENELLTPREKAIKFKVLSDKCFEAVNVSKFKTYWFFGARFELSED